VSPRCAFVGFAAALAASTALAAQPAYDPLARAPEAPRTLERGVRDGEREIPVRVYLPPRLDEPAPVVLFSHGLGGSRTGSAYCGEHWAARGYVAVFLQHPGSDEAVWRGLPPAQRLAALQHAASFENFRLRVSDVKATLDALAAWAKPESGDALAGRLDLARIGMAGHSFGAVTTQALGGQRFPLVGARFADSRIRAAIALSPSTPRRGSAGDAFGGVRIPWLLMTGSADAAPIGGQTPASRQRVFPALPRGDKYELVLAGAEHSAFTDRALPGDRKPRNPNHHRAVLALSTAFWDATLRGDAAAKAWLQSEAPRALLEPADRWRWK
jgi:predicted dienelactone hydrolase